MTDLLTQLRDYGRQIESDPMLGATPPHTVDVATQPPQTRLGRGLVWAVAAFAVVLALGGLYSAFSGDDGQVVEQTTVPTPTTPQSLFLDTWVSIDGDGSTPTMTIRGAEVGAVEMLVHDDLASVCSGAPSTMIGTGQLEGTTTMIVPSAVLTCDDGSEPQALSGPPLAEQLRDLTFIHDPETDVLTDNLGSVWAREGAQAPSPEPTTLGAMWPQSSPEEVQDAQELADADDPGYTWQVWPNVFPKRPGEMDPLAEEFFTRFLQEELGWEEFNWSVAPGLYAGVSNDWPWEFVVVRCAPGRTNPLYPNDPEGRGCAPTIDEHRYETVRINADQPTRHWEDPNGPSGIWVVTRWAMLQSITDTNGLLRIAAPAFQRQVQQVAPPSEADATAFLRAFLQARLDGEGAEEHRHAPAGAQVPLLYATTSDAPYERFEFDLVQGPVWPGGWMEFKVRLFAEGGSTVVEQPFVVDRGEDGRLVLLYGTLEDEDVPTAENGEALAEPYSILDGEVTFGVAPPWYAFFDYGPETIALDSGDGREADFAVLPDPLLVETGCNQGPAPADAEELADSIRSDPDLETTEPVAASVGGIEALRIDVVAAAGASVCADQGTPLVVSGPQLRGPALERGARMRLYLLDLPEGSSARTLAIVFVAPQAGLDSVLEEAPRILGSFEFHAP